MGTNLAIARLRWATFIIIKGLAYKNQAVRRAKLSGWNFPNILLWMAPAFLFCWTFESNRSRPRLEGDVEVVGPHTNAPNLVSSTESVRMTLKKTNLSWLGKNTPKTDFWECIGAKNKRHQNKNISFFFGVCSNDFWKELWSCYVKPWDLWNIKPMDQPWQHRDAFRPGNASATRCTLEKRGLGEAHVMPQTRRRSNTSISIRKISSINLIGEQGNRKSRFLRGGEFQSSWFKSHHCRFFPAKLLSHNIRFFVVIVKPNDCWRIREINVWIPALQAARCS